MKAESSMPIFGALALAIFSMFFRLFVITKVWAFVAVPLGAPAITWYQAFSLGFLLSAISYNAYAMNHKSKSTAFVARKTVNSISQAAMVLFLSWLFFA